MVIKKYLLYNQLRVNDINISIKYTMGEKKFIYNHSRPYVAVDCVVLAYDKPERMLKALLQVKGNAEEKWGLPARILRCSDNPDDEWDGGETLEQAVRAALTKRTYNIMSPDNTTLVKTVEIHPVDLPDDQTFIQLEARSDIQRDKGRKGSHKRVITIPFLTLVKYSGKDISDYGWVWAPLPQIMRDNAIRNPKDCPSDGNVYRLAFDHPLILQSASERLKEMAHLQPLGRGILPDRFTIADLQAFYEVILDMELERSNFRKAMMDRNHLEKAGQEKGPSRPSDLFKFKDDVYDEYVRKKDFAFNPERKKQGKSINLAVDL